MDTLQTAFPGLSARVTTPLDNAAGAGLRFIDATWRLDGSYNFQEAQPGSEARAVFFVDIEGPNPDLTRARAVIERVRASGMIPTVRFTYASEAALVHELYTYKQVF